MALTKACIVVLDGKDNATGTKIEVMFNPVEYSLEKSNQFQNTNILGLATPLTQFVSGNATVLTMDLFFDTYEKGEDVRNYTKKLTRLLEIDEKLHAPPRCLFVWGKDPFKATIEKISQKCTMFLADGTPVRSTLNVTFKEYKTLSEQLSSPPRQSADRSKARVMTEGDSLWLMADREYGNPAEWRMIARANDIDNPRLVPPGTQLRVPPRV